LADPTAFRALLFFEFEITGTDLLARSFLPELHLMASQKVRPTALRRFFRTSTYLMYAFAPEKPPGLVGRNFCLTIFRVFANASHLGVGNILLHPDG
jgi:hypothetical protein